jgi:serine protease inhibitor
MKQAKYMTARTKKPAAEQQREIRAMMSMSTFPVNIGPKWSTILSLPVNETDLVRYLSMPAMLDVLNPKPSAILALLGPKSTRNLAV